MNKMGNALLKSLSRTEDLECHPVNHVNPVKVGRYR